MQCNARIKREKRGGWQRVGGLDHEPQHAARPRLDVLGRGLGTSVVRGAQDRDHELVRVDLQRAEREERAAMQCNVMQCNAA